MLTVNRSIRCLLIVIAMAAGGGQATAQNNKDGFKDFYRSPDLNKVSGLIQRMDAAGRFSQPGTRLPMIGFLAALFAHYPDRFHWGADQLSIHGQIIVSSAMIIGGRNEAAVEYLIGKGHSDKTIVQIARPLRPLSDWPITMAGDFDLLWGASMATGSDVYPRRILNHFNGIVASGKFPIEDIALIPQLKTSANKEQGRALFEKHGRENFSELLMAGAALWSLASNAKQHAFVEDVLTDQFNRMPNADSTYLLKRQLFRSRARKMVMGDGKSVSVSLAVIDDIDEFHRITAEGGPEMIQKFHKVVENEFVPGSPVHVVAFFFVEPGAIGGEYSLTVTAPNGAESHFKNRMETRPGGDYHIVANSYPIPAEPPTEQGTYTVHGRFPDGDGGMLEVANQFFVGRQTSRE